MNPSSSYASAPLERGLDQPPSKAPTNGAHENAVETRNGSGAEKKAERKSPKVAVITRTKERGLLLRRAIGSVLKQTFEDWVHVIVNDGGNRDALECLVGEYATEYQGRVLVLHNAESTGMQNASNLGIRASGSDYITIHDDDDSWHPCFLEECVHLLESQDPSVEYAGVVSQTERVLEHITLDGRIVERARERYMPLETVNLYKLAEANLFAPIAFLYKREAHSEIGWFNNRYTVLGDWDFNLRFVLKYQVVVHERALAYYHWRDPELGGVYANTVTDGIEEHHQMSSLLRNDYLRDDLAANRQGLGFLLNLAKPITGNSKLIFDVQRTAQQTLSAVKNLRSSSGKKKSDKGSGKAEPEAADAADRAGKFRVRQRNRDFLALARKRLATCSVLSVDIFDTALFRTLQQPIDLFKWMEPEIRSILELPQFPFATARPSAEEVARIKQEKRAGHREVTLAEIHTELLTRAGLPLALLPRLIEAEHRAETVFCYANPLLLKLCREAVSGGKRLVYLSDMYLESDFLRKLMLGAGFPAAPIIVSGEHAASKHEGDLFPVLLAQMQVPPDAILHIGDKRTADFIHPRQAGLKAVHYDVLASREVFASDGHATGSFTEGNIASSLTIGLAKARLTSKAETKRVKADQFWEQIGYEIAGPLYLGYANWIFQRCQALKIDRAFFLARDGKNVSEVFEKLCQNWGGKITAHYMYGSRRLLNFARIEKLDTRSLDFLMSANPGMRIRHFFERIGFDYRTVQEDWAPLRRGIWDQLITTDKGHFVSNAWERTLKEMLLALEHRIVAAAREEKTVLQGYFDSIGFPAQRAAVVDIGWQASLLHSLNDLVTEEDEKSPLYGLYFGTWKQAQKVRDGGVPLESWFIDLELPKVRTWTVWECVEFFEFLFNATHPTIVGLRAEADGGYAPIYGKSDFEARQLEALEIIRVAAFRYVDDFLALHPSPPPAKALLTYLEAAFKRVLSNPRRDEAKIIGRLPHRGGFGDRSPLRHLAQPPSRLWRKWFPRENIRQYKQSFWKKGYLAQVSAGEARKLRSS